MLWAVVAQRTLEWLQRQDCSPRDALVLLPFAALLAPARLAFAQASAGAAWQPRIETVQTLAASLGPPPQAVAAGPERGPTGDPALDRLAAAALLRRQAWGRDWWRRDRRGFEHAVTMVVQAAQALAQAAAAQPPARRAAWWDSARQDLPTGVSGPGRTEAALARSALEWAALADTWAVDRLYAHSAGAWLQVQCGGPDRLAEALLTQAWAGGTPVMVWSADSDGDDPFDPGPPTDAPWSTVELALAADAEDEALATAAAVIEALARGSAPLALVAEDRLLVRRVRALLERAGVSVHDETGWTLATTRAAAQVMALLRAAAPQAGDDAWLDWLKTGPAAGEAALSDLELRWRAGRPVPAGSAAGACWRAAQAALQPLVVGPRTRPAGAWIQALRQVLDDQDALTAWQQDPAVQQVRATLRLDAPPQDDLPLDLEGFTALVDATLESAVFTLAPGPQAVVVTPLARAIGRPFALAVVPGADAVHLGYGGPGPALLPEALLVRLGLPGRAQRQWQRGAALAALARLPHLQLLRCRAMGDDPLADSPLVQRLDLARRAAGGPGIAGSDVQLPRSSVPLSPVLPPRPQALDDLPERLSASLLQALRDCPYRFFARAVLGLSEAEELASDADARDQGNWLHEVLRRFHAERIGPESAEAEAARLVALADAVAQDPAVVGSLDAADLLPFRVDLDALARHYVGWLHAREAEGWRWESGETSRQALLRGLDGLRLQGRIDRIDLGPGGQRAVLDYKTGSADGVKKAAATPLDNVQLAFYVALLGDPPVAQAAYVMLDARQGVATVAPDAAPADLARALEHGLAGEWLRLRQGAVLPALGSGDLCERCEMRGLCRRDHWADDA